MGVSSKNRSGVVQRGATRGKEVHSSRKRMCADFLTYHFEELPAYDIKTVTARCGEVDLPTLESQTKDFLHIYGREVDITHTGNNCRDVVALNNLLKENLPDVDGIELVDAGEDDGEVRSEFVAYKEIPCEDFPVMTIFFMPIKIVSNIDKGLRDILLDFFTFLDWKAPFLQPKASYDMCYSLGIEEDGDVIDDAFAENWAEDYRQEAERYVKGDINAVFEEMKERKKDCYGNEQILLNSIKEKINAYRKNGKKWYKTPFGVRKKTEELFGNIEQGIALTLEDSLFNYSLKMLRYKFGDETFFEYVETDEIMDFDRQFIFSWGLNEEDCITEDLMDCINADAGNISSTVLLNTVRISECDTPVKACDYPKRWYEWYIKLLNCIYE